MLNLAIFRTGFFCPQNCCFEVIRIRKGGVGDPLSVRLPGLAQWHRRSPRLLRLWLVGERRVGDRCAMLPCSRDRGRTRYARLLPLLLMLIGKRRVRDGSASFPCIIDDGRCMIKVGKRRVRNYNVLRRPGAPSEGEGGCGWQACIRWWGKEGEE